jgi:hypothetical protein
MKIILGFLLLNSFIIIACHKKSVPVITARTIEPSAPQTKPTGFAPDTVAGKTLFATRCNRCHGIPDIQLYSSKRWDIILAAMIPKARLSKEQGAHLTAYVKVNSHD